jgi:hypothetical protein
MAARVTDRLSEVVDYGCPLGVLRTAGGGKIGIRDGAA